MSGADPTRTEPRILELPRCALVILSGPERGRETIIDGDRFRIGKSKENGLVLLDETVSRAHCEIVRDRRGYLLRDLGSTNGTFLDGAEIKEAWIKAGAVITVGTVELKVRPFSERIEAAPSERTRYGELLGRSLAMRQVFGLLERVGPSDATLLIRGEAGTGKETLARSVHALSPRAQGPFVSVDCAAPTSLLDADLFGTEEGAHGARPGAFERASGGTLFLDDVAELPIEISPKVLRALEERSVRRSSAGAPARVDVRVIATTRRDLRSEVERGKFPEELLLRLAVVPIELPPLRDRREDVDLLVAHLLGAGGGTGGPSGAGAAIVDALGEHDWPGNVRELRGVLERARAAAPSLAGLPPLRDETSYRESKSEWDAFFERRYVAWLLERRGGNISAAARAADMDRKYLFKLACRHGLHAPRR